MPPTFFSHPILSSPYDYLRRHWELDAGGQPTDVVVEARRRSAPDTSPVPRAKKQRASQKELELGDASGLSTATQRYDPTPVINELRGRVDAWRALPNPNDWGVTPETARLLERWRSALRFRVPRVLGHRPRLRTIT